MKAIHLAYRRFKNLYPQPFMNHHIVKKVWGYEEWIVNNNLYCGKRFFIKKGFRCSLHYHKVKTETFYLLSGKIVIETQNKNEAIKLRLMNPGESVFISPYTLHRFSALETSEVIEFSTPHFEEDSYRLEPSSSVDTELLRLSVPTASIVKGNK